MTAIVSQTLSILTLLSQLFLLWIVVYHVISFENARKLSKKILTSKNALLAVFTISFFASSGSLFYSEIAGFVPCELCWFQRIFMYPQVILYGIAMYKKKTDIFEYSFWLVALGIIISAYQNYLIYAAAKSTSCGISGASCATKFVIGLGYVTIPMMALTAFVLIGTIILLYKFTPKEK